MAEWAATSSIERYSNYLSASLLGLVTLILLILALYLSCNYNAFKYEDFVDFLSPIVEGTRYEDSRARRKIAVSYQTIFILRRTLFVYSMIY